MKINELARISRVNPETIRMYRNRGLLFPRQGENGYFDYSWDDLQNLLYIRKLRGMNLTLSTISHTYSREDVKEIVAEFQRERDNLSVQMDELNRQLFMLQVHLEHYQSYQRNLGSVIPIHVPDDRYDIPFDDDRTLGLLNEWLDNIDLLTQGLHVPRELLRGEAPLPGQVPVQMTLGTYRLLFEGNGVSIPPEAACVPGGLYLAVSVERRGGCIDSRPLKALLDYAREHAYALTGESTAFLFRVNQTPDGPVFIYRLRARVAEDP